MLTTLIKPGEQLSDGRGEWDDIIDFPNIAKEKAKNIKCFVAELVFDLDSKIVYVSHVHKDCPCLYPYHNWPTFLQNHGIRNDIISQTKSSNNTN